MREQNMRKGKGAATLSIPAAGGEGTLDAQSASTTTPVLALERWLARKLLELSGHPRVSIVLWNGEEVPGAAAPGTSSPFQSTMETRGWPLSSRSLRASQRSSASTGVVVDALCASSVPSPPAAGILKVAAPLPFRMFCSLIRGQRLSRNVRTNPTR